MSVDVAPRHVHGSLRTDGRVRVAYERNRPSSATECILLSAMLIQVRLLAGKVADG